MFPTALPGLVFLFAAVSAQQFGFTLPLTRGPGRIPRLGQAVNNIPLTNSQQYTYIVQAAIGQQIFQFVLDTGSSDLWVVSSQCSNQDCRTVPRFSPSLSTTLSQTGLLFELDYLVGKVHGEIAFDTVALGPYQVQSQIFATVDETANLGLASTATSGILGFCFPDTAAIPATTGATLLQNLMSFFDDPARRFFAFHLSRNSGSGSNDPNASFSLGSLDPAFAPDPNFIAMSPVLRTGTAYDYWKLPLLRFTFNGQPFTLSASRVPGALTAIVVLDSGTTLILGPTADVDALYALFGPAARNDPSAGYQIRCTYAALLGVVLGDPPREYLLHPADVSWAEGAAGGWCTGGIQPNDNVNAADWLFGDVFLRNVYAVHYTDPPVIGLVPLTEAGPALDEFRNERGPDVDDGGADADADDADTVADDGWDTSTGYVKRWEHIASGAGARVFGAVAGGIGFVVGGPPLCKWLSLSSAPPTSPASRLFLHVLPLYITLPPITVTHIKHAISDPRFFDPVWMVAVAPTSPSWTRLHKHKHKPPESDKTRLLLELSPRPGCSVSEVAAPHASLKGRPHCIKA
ncbi:aspartic peptidase domain-containing protein [Mycena rosella]|uniref:Aspartic peptidase domain-containing protein n=1 Tax=Mycena rosella TaxID=1033263 RepID=A0AAD7DXV5_MYCRO|nr:aspartic peptidase domain-containing protein [Mycena rosella]